jgi:hypothetical protein
MTWVHVFDRSARFDFSSCSTGFQPVPSLAASKEHGFEARATAVRVGGTDLSNCDGFVAINSKISDARLGSAGFTYIRRFAVLPDMQTARWYVPLDAPAISSAAFSLYSPAKFSARMKVLAARIAAHSRLPVWYKDSLLIAQQETPPIERKMVELFPGREIRLAMSSGAPEPARNRKVSLAIIGMDGQILGFAKVAGSDLSLRLLRDESHALRELANRNIGAPTVNFTGEVDGAFVTVQDPLTGKPVTAKMTANKLALLASLRSERMQRATESNMLAALPRRLTNLPISRPELNEALADVLPILEQTRVPSTIVHGDFAPWNLREHNRKVAAFDWEYAELDGLPLIDETHYRLQVGYLLDKWSLDDARAALARMGRENELGLRAEQVRAIQVVYFIDNLARLFAEGYDETENEMVAWYCRLLRRLLEAKKEVVRA